MIKKLHESFKNLPKWITNNLNKYQLTTLDKKGIDLYNCTYEEADDLKMRDSRWTDSNLIPIFLLRDTNFNGKEVEKLYIWNIIDPVMSDGKDASKHNRQWLINNAIHKGFINISANKKPSKDRYVDPRNSTPRSRLNKHQFYAGQRKIDYNGDVRYYSEPGRDKSGYEIPRPDKKLAKLYEFDLDNYADVLERYYNKLNKLKNTIFNIDIKSSGDNYEKILRYLGGCINDYKELSKEIDRVIKAFNNLPEEKRTPEQFKELTDWMYYGKQINSDIIDLQKLLKNMN